MANTRLRRCAQLIARCRSVAAASPRSATVRVLGTIRARSRLAGANTPWYLVKWVIQIFALLILAAFPDLVTWLPDKLYD